MSAAWLILPTYNEAENLEPMVEAVLPKLASAGVEPHVLVVDDASPDGTGEIADRLAGELDEVEVLHRDRKEGLGRAYLAGFTHALDGGADLILQMDCDFSHDPADLPRLIAAAGRADLVLGSRYVAGGRRENWAMSRRPVARRLPVRAGDPRRARARPHRRLQVLAAVRSRRSTSPAWTPTATASRSR